MQVLILLTSNFPNLVELSTRYFPILQLKYAVIFYNIILYKQKIATNQ